MAEPLLRLTLWVLSRHRQSREQFIHISVSLLDFSPSAILFPRILSPDEIGLLKLLVSFSIIFAQLGSLGFINAINRLFPYFRHKESGHQGFLTVAIVVSSRFPDIMGRP